MHVYELTSKLASDYFHCKAGVLGYYASKRKAEAKATELRVKQAREEEEDWIANPCECGDRKCDYREHFFDDWEVSKIDLAELSMRELMRIELADADQD